MRKIPIKLYNTLVFYDFEYESIQWRELYFFVLKFFEDHGQNPLRMSLHGQGVKESSKTKTFRHYDKAIRQINFRGIKSFWLGGKYPEDYGSDQGGCFIGFSLNHSRFFKLATLYFEDRLIPYDAALFKKLSKSICNDLEAQYGFALQLNQYKKDSLMYALPGLDSDETEEEEAETLNWDHAYNDPYKDCGTYKTGDFRDLYPLNFIGRSHLDRKVFGQTLEDWILSDPARGTLEPLNDTLWTWEIPQDHIPDLRQALKPTDLLVCFRPYESF